MQSPVAPDDRVPAVGKGGRSLRLLWWFLGIAAGLVAIVFLLLPPLLKPVLESELSKALSREVEIETLRINPFAPSVTVRGFVMDERSGNAPFLTFDELYLNAGWRSITRLAPVVDEATLTRPHLRLIRNPDRSYNFQDLFDETMIRMRSDDPTPKFAAFNLRIVDGRVDFDDLAGHDQHEITELKLGIPFISSLDSDVDVTVAPAFSARVNGALIGLKGEMLPFKDTRLTALNVDLDKFDLARLVAYLPFELRGTVESALLDTRLVVTFEQPNGARPRIKVRGAAAVTELNMQDLQDRPLVVCPRIAVEINEVDALAPAVDLKRVVIEAPEVHVRREPTGAINLQRVGDIAVEGDRVQRRARRDTGQAAVGVKFGSFVVQSGRVWFSDETTDPAYEGRIDDVRIEAREFDNTVKDHRNHMALEARTEQGESFKLEVASIADPRFAEGRLEVDGLRLKRFQPYVTQASNLEVEDGRFDIGVNFQWASDLSYEKHELKLADLGLVLRDFRARLRDEKEPLFRVASIQVDGAAAKLAQRSANLGSITARGAAILLRREKDGTLNLARIPRKDAVATPPPDAPARAAESGVPPGTPWRIDLGAFTLADASVVLEDRAVGVPVKLSIAPVQFKVKNLSTKKGQRGNVDLRAAVGQDGTLAASGPISLEPVAGSLRIEARTIDLALAQPYIDDRTRFAVTSGAVSAKGTAGFERAAEGTAALSYKGDVRVTGFAAVEKPGKADLVKWKELSVGAVDFELEPLKLGLGKIALTDFYGRLVVSPGGRLNWQDLMQSPASAPVEKAAADAGGGPSPDIRLGAMTFTQGTIDFTDSTIKPAFHAELRDIHGSLSAMTPKQPSALELQAKGQRSAVFDIRGRLDLLAPSRFLDLEGTAEGVELPPLSAYAAKYVGYEIERGKLSLNVDYQVENGKLVASNNIVLHQLSLGDKVDSPDAMDLPVPAAVTILKKRSGVVDINVPISGSLDDPQFSVAEAIVQAFGNLIAKTVSAPFALLGAAVGGGAELSYIEFAPGSATLDADDIAKLRTLVQALSERPGVNIDLRGRVDPVADGEALARTRFGFRKRISDTDLQRLAEARAEAARSWLVNEGKLPGSRVFLVSPKLTAEGIRDEGKPSRVDFRVK